MLFLLLVVLYQEAALAKTLGVVLSVLVRARTHHLGLALVRLKPSQIALLVVPRVSFIPHTAVEGCVTFFAVALAHGVLVIHLNPLSRTSICSSERQRLDDVVATAKGVLNPLEDILLGLLEVIFEVLSLVTLFSGLAANLST